jgi:hypothetical protein
MHRKKHRPRPIIWELATRPDGGPVILERPCECHWFLAMIGKRRGEAGYYSGWIFGESADLENAVPVPGNPDAYTFKMKKAIQRLDEEMPHPTIDAGIEAARLAAQQNQQSVLTTIMTEGGARH